MTARRKPRMTCPGCGAVYVLERPGEGNDTAQPEQTGDDLPAHHDMPARSHDWYVAFFRQRADPSAAPFNVAPLGRPAVIVNANARRMLQDARTGTGTRCERAKRPSESERAAMVKIPAGSPQLDAWRRTLADEGYPHFGDDGAQWLLVPSEWPPGWNTGPPTGDGEGRGELETAGEEARQ
jgi:hypothetical protein